MSRCKSCGSTSSVRDPYSGTLSCSDCGSVLELHTYDAQLTGFFGPSGAFSHEGTFVSMGTSGTGDCLSYKEKKVFQAQNLITDLVFKLGLPLKSSEAVKDMIFTITEGEYGEGLWFPVLICACCCIVTRKENRSLPMNEAAVVAGCNEYELGRMLNRVVDFLELRKESEFPVYNIVTAFDRAIREFKAFSKLPPEEVNRLHKQGLFLIQCCVKWCLTTGRKPLPVVVAVLVFVAQLNSIQVKIEDVAMEFHSKVHTSKKRYKELSEALVEASQALPWAKDITVKNIMQNAPFVIQYMEKKSMLKKKKNLLSQTIDLEDVLNECLRTDLVYDSSCRSRITHDSVYYDAKVRDSRVVQNNDMTVSTECLGLLYTKFLEESKNFEPVMDRPSMDLYDCEDWWKGKSDLSRKLVLQEILDKDVGMDPMPPSFVHNGVVNQMRREKIRAAKERIGRVMRNDTTGGGEVASMKKRSRSSNGDEENKVSAMKVGKNKKRRRKNGVDIDWEDFIIETLLLHQVKEEEIVKGHYKALMGLYVFNSGIM